MSSCLENMADSCPDVVGNIGDDNGASAKYQGYGIRIVRVGRPMSHVV